MKETGHHFLPCSKTNRKVMHAGELQLSSSEAQQSPSLWVSPWTPVREGDTADSLGCVAA